MEQDLDQLLHMSPSEQISFEKDQNLYSLIKTIEYLEWAYMSGKIKGQEYDAEFRSLYHHFDMCIKSIPNFAGIDKFFALHQLDHCQTAKQRVKTGMSGYKGEETDKSLAIRVMDITSKMIGAMDQLEMDYCDIDLILPSIKTIQSALDSYPNLSSDNQCKVKITKWVNILDQRTAADSLTEDEKRQLKFDLSSSYQQFEAILHQN